MRSRTSPSLFASGHRGGVIRSGLSAVSLGLALVIALGVCLPVSAQAESAARYMQRVANELIKAQRSGSSTAYARTIRSHADIPSIGMYSLGSYARGLPRSQRSRYYSGMVKFISRYAAKEGANYRVSRAVVVGQSEETREGVYVDSVVTLASGATYDVRWWLVRRGKVYKVRDAQVIGFWMSPFLKNLFENYISENGGNPKALVIALNK